MRSKFILLQLLLALCIYGCNKGCNDPTGNRGIIIRRLSDSDLPCWELKQKNFLITNDSAYKATFQVDSLQTFCKDVKPEPIDFMQYSLLGQYAVGGNTDFLRTVTRNDAEKKVIYEIIENSCGGHEVAIVSANLVLIPKVPDDYTAEFISK